MKFSSTGPTLVVIDSKTKPGFLGIKNPGLVMQVAFQVQVYGDTGFLVRPKHGLIPVRGTVDVELLNGKPDIQSFHVVAIYWPYGNNEFDKDTWKRVERERKDKDKVQVVTFGNPPKYKGIKDSDENSSSSKSDKSVRPETKSSGPTILNAHIPSISFKPPTGKVQTVVLKLSNLSSSKPAAFKIMVNKGPFYTIRPGKGILDIKKEIKIEIAMNKEYTKKDFENDNRGHELHVLAIKWPKKIEEYNHDEWNRLEKARKDLRQRLVIAINHKGLENAPPDGIAKKSSELTKGPTLVEINPQKIIIAPPLTNPHTLNLKNVNSSSCVAFKLQTNRPNFYIVNPNKGLIKAGATKQTKIEVNENLSVKDFHDAEGHQFLMLALEWPNEKEFDPDQFAALMKTKRIGLQKLCIDVELEIASKNIYVTAVPRSLSYKPPGISPQTLSITLANKSPKTVAYTIETGHPSMNSWYTINSETGLIKSGFSSQIAFTLSDKARETDLPTDPVNHCFKVNAISWPLPTFNEDLWKEYESFKKEDMQVMRIGANFEGLDDRNNANESGPKGLGQSQGADAMMMAILMQQMCGMNQNPAILGGMGYGQQNFVYSDPEPPQEDDSDSSSSISEKKALKKKKKKKKRK